MIRFDHIVTPDVLFRMDGERYDADVSAVFARQLEKIVSRTYDVEYVELKARSLFPTLTEVDAADRTFTYRQREYKGEARIVHNYGLDFPTVEIQGSEKTHSIVSLGNAYEYSIMDLRYANRAGVDLDGWKARAAREVMEFKLESIAARGDSSNGIATGFFNAPSILSVTLATKAATGTRWFNANGTLNATVAEILADFNAMQSKIHTTTKGKRHGTTFLCDTLTYGGLMTTARAPGFTDDTIGQYLLKQSPWLKSIEHWAACDTGDGTNARAMLYDRSQDVVELVLPQDFEQMPPQPRGMAFRTNCHMRTGGVVVNLPSAVCYADGIAS